MEYYTTGSPGLKNLGSGRYQFNFKTSLTWASKCRTLGLQAKRRGRTQGRLSVQAVVEPRDEDRCGTDVTSDFPLPSDPNLSDSVISQ